jgi:hypothetical protein
MHETGLMLYNIGSASIPEIAVNTVSIGVRVLVYALICIKDSSPLSQGPAVPRGAEGPAIGSHYKDKYTNATVWMNA